MPNDVTIVYNLYNDPDVPPAKLAELQRAVKWLRASDTFSMEYWLAHMSDAEAAKLMQDMLGVARSLGERLQRELPWVVFGLGFDDRQIGERLRNAKTMLDLRYEDQIRVITSPDGQALVRIAHHDARLKWLEGVIQKQMDQQARTAKEEFMRTPFFADVMSEIDAMQTKNVVTLYDDTTAD